jgi:hypothetical protein
MKATKRPPLRWHIVCLGRTIAKFWKRADAIESRKLWGNEICCKVKFVKGGRR